MARSWYIRQPLASVYLLGTNWAVLEVALVYCDFSTSFLKEHGAFQIPLKDNNKDNKYVRIYVYVDISVFQFQEVQFHRKLMLFYVSTSLPVYIFIMGRKYNSNVGFQNLRRSFGEINVNNAFWRYALPDIHFSVNYWYRNLSLQRKGHSASKRNPFWLICLLNCRSTHQKNAGGIMGHSISSWA